MIDTNDKKRKELIANYKKYWFNELRLGATMEELELEISICEFIEDYEQCEGIIQAKKEFKEYLKLLDL